MLFGWIKKVKYRKKNNGKQLKKITYIYPDLSFYRQHYVTFEN